MAAPEVYFAHSKSIAKRIIEGEIKPDLSSIKDKLKKSYNENIAIKIAECAIKLAEKEMDKKNPPCTTQDGFSKINLLIN